MEDEAWSYVVSTSSRSYRSALKSPSDLCIDFEEAEVGDDDFRGEYYACPFCTDDFDLIDLCCHIDDEHPSEFKPAVCPVCLARVRTDMVGHIRTQHTNSLKSLQKFKLHRGESHATLPYLKKELEDEYLQSILAESSSLVSSPKMVPDPLLSFLYNVPSSNKPASEQPSCSTEVASEENISDQKRSERKVDLSPLSDKEHAEKAKRSEFVQGLLMSIILDDSL